MAALGLRRRIKLGPALRIAPLPIGGLTLSVLSHATLIIAIVLAVSALQETQGKVYVVNLVPAVAALGSPQSETPAPPQPKAEPPAPRPAPKEPPPRPAPPRELPAREPSPPREMPARELPPRDLPPRDLPDRALPSRTAATPTPLPPRADQKDLPTVASAKAPTPVTPPPAPAREMPKPTPAPPTTASVPPPPPPPAGQPGGSPVGVGKVTLDVDFPYAWYLRVLANKINERWEGRALPGNQPIIVFEIERNGSVSINKMKVEKSSGNPPYDQVAMRAIAEALPFPPLPEDFKASYLRIHLQFQHRAGG